jgi:hypothetical protein
MSPPQMVQTAAALTRAVKPRKKFCFGLILSVVVDDD